MKRTIKAALTVLAIITAAPLLGFCLYAGIMYQFEIYQKKHGEHMTFTDFLFDAERK